MAYKLSLRRRNERARWWLRAGVWWAIFAGLLALDRLLAPSESRTVSDGSRATTAACAPHSEQVWRIGIAARGADVVLRREGDHWYRGEQRMPSDLVQAFLESLGSCALWPVVASQANRWPEFGVAEPVAIVRLEAADGATLQRIAFGENNPVGTGRYARRNDDPQVFLVGAQQWYYVELLAGVPLDKRP
ncbi:hypothetical protein HRbin30_02532 [bacterium HR30]|nr:hypothetical protein HRbin30_02532 [bacterium HR30]